MVSIKSCFALSLILAAPSLFGAEYVSIYNNTIYTANVLVDFGGFPGEDTPISGTIAPTQSTKIKIPTKRFRNGQRELSIRKITVTVPEETELVWKDGKPGSQLVGVKVKRAAKSVVFTQGSGQGRQESASFVINANRNLGFINGIGQIDNLAIYRFIQ